MIDSSPSTPRILLVTGMSGAGKSTALHTLEDLGWETVDNLPVSLFEKLFEAPTGRDNTDDQRPLAIGIDTRTRGFQAQDIVARIKAVEADHGRRISTLFLDCNGAELEKRFSETRRRHPLALDRPAEHGISREREVLLPLRRWAEFVIDTSACNAAELRQEIRQKFGVTEQSALTLTVASFGFARGMLRNADLVFDMRFLRNPHWDEELRPLTGQDGGVANFIAEDEAYEDAVSRIEELLSLLVPRYSAAGKAYVTIAFGCTGGRHRSVHVAERVAARLRDAGFSPTITHRDLTFPPLDAVEQIETKKDKGRNSV